MPKSPSKARSDVAQPSKAKRPVKEDRHFVTALARGLQVLQSFASGEERLGNQELSERCSMPKSTVSRLTYTLTKLGFLHHDDDAGRYRLGMATLSLGGTTLSRLDAKEISRPIMQKLADSTQCLVALGIRDGMSMLYVETCRSESVVTLRLNVGSRMPLATSSMGRAYLAAVKAGARRGLEDRMRTLDPAFWPSIEEGIHKAIVELEEFGCCSSFGDWRPEVHGIAAPLRVGKGMPLMILSAAGPAQTMPAEIFMRDIRPALLSAAQEIERQFRPRS